MTGGFIHFQKGWMKKGIMTRRLKTMLPEETVLVNCILVKHAQKIPAKWYLPYFTLGTVASKAS